jgi:hypothetical protein
VKTHTAINISEPQIILQFFLFVPQYAMTIELCLRITAATTTLHHLIRWFDGSTSLAAHYKIIDVAQRFCSQLGVRVRPQEMNLFIAAFAASFWSSQNRCVVAANVMRHAMQFCRSSVS